MDVGRKTPDAQFAACCSRRITPPQCNRRYPCNQCTKRRQPEACTYHTSQASHQTPAPQPDTRVREDVRIEAPQADVACSEVAASSDWTKTKGRALDRAAGSLAGMFAYVEHSESNTLALVLKVCHYTSCSRAILVGAGGGCKWGMT